jgi:hypothetical protein
MRVQIKWARDAQTSGPVAPKADTFDAPGTLLVRGVAFLARNRSSLGAPTKGAPS